MAAARAGVVRGLQNEGFIPVLQQYFALDERQLKQLSTVSSSRQGEEFWNATLVAALLQGANITISHTVERNFDLELHLGIGGSTLDLSIHC